MMDKKDFVSGNYRVCTRCIMDTTDPAIEFDEKGVCNHCRYFDNVQKKQMLDGEESRRRLDEIIEAIKKDSGNSEYDCIIGLSGGVDSTYVAFKVVELGLRPLAMHFDSGWNSELAVSNIENIVKKLDIDLVTFVVDWEEMRDLQLSFFKASVANCDIPQDHAFLAALYKTAVKNNIRYIVSGNNIATESVLPEAWGYSSRDLRHLEGIQKKFGKLKLKKFPRYNIFEYMIYYPYIKGIKVIQILNYLSYIKAEAKETITRELGWRDYGGKHCESVFTKFFQSYYLPVKFGYDKRKAHLSSLILSGQITREDALEEMRQEIYPSGRLKEDKEFVIKKLGITEKEFEGIMALPSRTFCDSPSNYRLFLLPAVIGRFLRKMGLLS